MYLHFFLNEKTPFFENYADYCLKEVTETRSWKVKTWSLSELISLHDTLLGKKDTQFPLLGNISVEDLSSKNKTKSHIFENFMEYAKNMVLYVHGGIVLDEKCVMVLGNIDKAIKYHSAIYQELYNTYEVYIQDGSKKLGLVLFSPSFSSKSITQSASSLFQSACESVDKKKLLSSLQNTHGSQSIGLSFRYASCSEQYVWCKLAALSVFRSKKNNKIYKQKISFLRATEFVVQTLYRDRPISDMVLHPRFYQVVKYRDAKEISALLSVFSDAVFLECENWDTWCSRNLQYLKTIQLPRCIHWKMEMYKNILKKKNHENSMELVQKKISNVIYSCERKCRRTLCVDMEIATYPIITATLFSALVTLIFFLIIRKHLGLR